MDIESIRKVLTIADMGSGAFGIFDIYCSEEPPCPKCGEEMLRDDDQDPNGTWRDLIWKCPFCGHEVDAEDIDRGNYLQDYEQMELKKEALSLGYVYSNLYHDIHDYDPEDPDDREYARIYG